MASFEELLRMNGITLEDAIVDKDLENNQALADIWEAICEIELFGLEMED